MLGAWCGMEKSADFPSWPGAAATLRLCPQAMPLQGVLGKTMHAHGMEHTQQRKSSISFIDDTYARTAVHFQFPCIIGSIVSDVLLAQAECELCTCCRSMARIDPCCLLVSCLP